MHQAAYCFFDAPFRLVTDTPAFLARFDQSYERFRVTDAAGAPEYRVLLAGEPALTLGNQTIHAADPEVLGHYAYQAILNAALARVRSHILLHAAALRTPDGRGLILAGGAGLGKTTLSLALVERHFGLLSDDVAAIGMAAIGMAAIGAADGWLYPFPRRPGLRLPGEQPGEKRQIDLPAAAPACPARFLFILADPAANPEQAPWYLVLDQAAEPLLAELRAIPGLLAARPVRDAPYPVVQLDLVPGAVHTVESEVKAACRRHHTLLFELVQGREAAPDFCGEPGLAPLSTLEASQELLRHFKGGPRSALLQRTFSGSAAQLFLTLVGLASGMICHRLDVGHLAGMVDRVVSTVDRYAPGEG